MVLKVKELIESCNNPKICINAALLYEMGLNELCQKIIIVKISLLKTFQRAKERDGASFLKVLKIITSQKVMKLANKNKEKSEIFFVNNNSMLNNLKQQIDNVIKRC